MILAERLARYEDGCEQIADEIQKFMTLVIEKHPSMLHDALIARANVVDLLGAVHTAIENGKFVGRDEALEEAAKTLESQDSTPITGVYRKDVFDHCAKIVRSLKSDG